jgi:hypothetical protein
VLVDKSDSILAKGVVLLHVRVVQCWLCEQEIWWSGDGRWSDGRDHRLAPVDILVAGGEESRLCGHLRERGRVTMHHLRSVAS